MNPNETIPDGASAPSTTDTTNPLDVQVGGAHYREGGIQPVEYIEANKLGFLEGCVVKRVTRHGRNGGKGRQDIEKAIHELQLLLKLRYLPATSSGAQEAPVAEPANPPEKNGKESSLALDFINSCLREGLGKSRSDCRAINDVVDGFFREYSPASYLWEVRPEHADLVVEKFKEAKDLLARGCVSVRMHYRPALHSRDRDAIYLSWAEPKTDPQNEKTDSENPKCEATDAKSEANFGVEPLNDFISTVRANPAEIMRDLAQATAAELGLSVDHQSFDVAAEMLASSIEMDSATSEPPAEEPKSEATKKIEKGDLVTYRGESYRVHDVNAAYGDALIKPDLDPHYWITTDLFVPLGDLTLAETDSATAEPPAAESKPEANYGVHYSGIRAGMSEEANPAEIMRSLAKAAAADLGLSVDHQSFDAAAAALESPIENNPATEEPPAAEPKPEATPKFKPGDGVYHRIRQTYGKVLQYPFGGAHLVGGLHFVAWTDGRNSVEHESDLLADPHGAETQSEAPKVVNKLNVDIGAGYAAMAKTFVRAIPNPTRLLGKHPALGARYELGQGGIAGLNSDSPFRAGGILDLGEAILPKGEEATAAGEAWTPMPGDKVRVVRKIKSHGGWNNYWVDLMDGAVGQVGRVKDFTDEDLRDNAVQLEFDGDPAWSDFWYPIPALERVTDAED